MQLLPSNADPVKGGQEIIAKNLLGKVSIFVTDGSTVLYDSRVVCEYLDNCGQRLAFLRARARRAGPR